MTDKKIYATNLTEPTQNIKYAYNYQKALSEVKIGGEVIAEYEYDTGRQRIYSKVNDEEKIYHWDSGNIVAEGTPTEDFKTRYIYSGNQKMAMMRDGKIYYFVNNLQGTPVLIFNEQGKIVQKIQMDEYGNVEQAQGIFGDEINFTGKKYEPSTGLYYFNQRYYDSHLGRFITEDPASQFLNPYLYGENNPLSYVDPNGEWFFAVLGAMMKGAFIGAFTNSAIAAVNGEDVGQAMRQGFAGGALSAGIFHGIGSIGLTTGSIEKIAMHGIGGGISSHLQGGDFLSGAIGGGVAQTFAPGIMQNNSSFGRIAASSIVGGLSSGLAGGDPIRGAMAGGFGMAFNELGDHAIDSDFYKQQRYLRELYFKRGPLHAINDFFSISDNKFKALLKFSDPMISAGPRLDVMWLLGVLKAINSDVNSAFDRNINEGLDWVECLSNGLYRSNIHFPQLPY